MTTTTTTPKMINLLEISGQIAVTAKKIHQKVEQTGDSVKLAASQLVKKYPEFKPLNDLVLFQVRNTPNPGAYACDTLTVFKSPSDEVLVYTPDLEPVTGNVKWLNYKSGFSGSCEVEIEGVPFTVAISTSEEHLNEIVKNSKSALNAKGKPPAKAIRLVPRPIIPLYSEKLETDVKYKILTVDPDKTEFDSYLFDLQDENGKVFKRVTDNQELARIYDRHGIGAEFKIVDRHLRKRKDGEIFDAKSGKSEKEFKKAKAKGEVSGDFKPSHKVTVLDLKGEDFSDLDI